MKNASRAALLILAILCWLAILDVALSFALQPQWPWGARVSALARYFEYGRSVEGKIARALDTPGADAVLKAGWIDPAQWASLAHEPAASEPDGRLVAVYGQSFALNATRAMAALEPRITLRSVAGPAAPLSYAFAAYRADTQGQAARVVVLGVLASSLAHSGLMSMTAATFESPAPFTFPAFEWRDGQLHEQTPVIRTYPEFVQAFRERGTQWTQFRQQLQEHSDRLDGFVFRQGWWDASVVVRLLRRGWIGAKGEAAPQGPGQVSPGFARQIPTALALLRQAQQLAVQRRQHLVVLLIEDRGHAGWLDKQLRQPVEAMGIQVISSSDSINPRDPASFVADGHFTEAANQRLAQALLRMLTPTLWP